jgi:SulP family sulfate permease
VVTGFTSGIAVIIFSSQVKDLLGLQIDKVPCRVLRQVAAFWDAGGEHRRTRGGASAGALAIILLLRRYAPRAPAFLIAVIAAALLAALLGLDVDTIGSALRRYRLQPARTVPARHLPAAGAGAAAERLHHRLPGRHRIAAVGSGRRWHDRASPPLQLRTGGAGRGQHRLPRCSAGCPPPAPSPAPPPASAPARARPIAGMLHAVFLLLFMLVAGAARMAWMPLASLAAVLVVVAWNMSEIERFRHLLRAPLGDRVVLLVTFVLTVLVDLTVAIAVGVVLASMLFMHRMSEVAAIASGASGRELGLVEHDTDDFTRPRTDTYSQREELPPGVEVFQFRGPLFFGVAGRLSDVFDAIGGSPRVFILRMREVPLVDATGAARLRDFVDRADRCGTQVLISGLQPQPRAVLEQTGVLGGRAKVTLVADFAAAVALARRLVES